VKGDAPRRSILHVDLDALFVSVERSLDPRLRGIPVIVGGDGSVGVVAAASPEARDHGVRTGQALAEARRLCPPAAFRPGDLEAYAKVSEDVTSVLFAASRRVERPSADEAYVDLTPEGPHCENPVQAAERIKDELQQCGRYTQEVIDKFAAAEIHTTPHRHERCFVLRNREQQVQVIVPESATPDILDVLAGYPSLSIEAVRRAREKIVAVASL